MPTDDLISLDDARSILLDGHGPLGTEAVPLVNLLGRVLAEPIRADHDQPPMPVSAMDGYAVHTPDAVPGAKLRLIGEAPAGAPFHGTVGSGECVKIATGGVVPLGADRIIIQENVTRDGDEVIIRDAAGPPFVRPAAMDFASGQVVIETGQRIGPAEIGIIAASGSAQVVVSRRPRVTILVGGDELRDPGTTLAPGTIYNSAGYALAALVELWGGTPHLAPIIPDDLDLAVAAIRSIDSQTDLFLPLGGASVGERDLFRPAFTKVGAEAKFWRINVVPGKPCWHARLGDGRAVLGLPGNPSSAYVCAHLLVKPLLDVLLGRDPPSMPLNSATLTTAIAQNGPREAWLRATVATDDFGAAIATVDQRQDSGLQTPLHTANALILRQPHAAPCEAGARVKFMRLSRI